MLDSVSMRESTLLWYIDFLSREKNGKGIFVILAEKKYCSVVL
jgi:hypothetical protein